MYGCRVVQKSLEVFKENYSFQNDIIMELRCHVMKLIQDQNGNHVIQKCFETVPSNKLEFIVDEVIANVIFHITFFFIFIHFLYKKD